LVRASELYRGSRFVHYRPHSNPFGPINRGRAWR
jgi:hypothetical protein